VMVAEGDSRTSGSLASPVARLVAAAAAFTVAATDVASSEFEQRSVVALSGEPNGGGSREKEKEQRRRLQASPVRASGDDDVAAVSRFIFPGKWRRRRCRSISRERGVKGDGVAGEASGGGRWWRGRSLASVRVFFLKNKKGAVGLEPFYHAHPLFYLNHTLLLSFRAPPFLILTPLFCVSLAHSFIYCTHPTCYFTHLSHVILLHPMPLSFVFGFVVVFALCTPPITRAPLLFCFPLLSILNIFILL